MCTELYIISVRFSGLLMALLLCLPETGKIGTRDCPQFSKTQSHFNPQPWMFIASCMCNTKHVIQSLEIVFSPCPHQSENCHGTYVIPFDEAFTFSHVLLHLRRGQDRTKHRHSGIPTPPRLGRRVFLFLSSASFLPFGASPHMVLTVISGTNMLYRQGKTLQWLPEMNAELLICIGKRWAF